MDNNVYKYVFPQKAKYIKNQVDSFHEISNDSHKRYPGALVLPAKKYDDYDVSHGRGGVVDENGRYIENSSTRARVRGQYTPDEFEICNKTVVYCGFFHKVWGHFITETISRLWYSLKQDPTVDAYIFIDMYNGNNSFTGNYYEFIKLLGIENKVLVINKPTRFKEVIIPFNGFDYGNYYTKQYVDMYNYIIQKGLSLYKGKTYERVYFSKRSLEISLMSNLNGRFLDRYFKKNGFKIFYPERLSLVDTIGIIQNAKIFAGISSSLAHNQLFGNENQIMVSIEKQAFYNPYQVFISKITGCRCIFVDACRHIFTVNAAGPFIFDYTKHLDMFTKDYNFKPSKSMSYFKYRHIFKKYMIYYFNFNNHMPPDYMYRQYVVDMSREMYNDTIETGNIFQMSLYQRCLLRLKKEILKIKNRKNL